MVTPGAHLVGAGVTNLGDNINASSSPGLHQSPRLVTPAPHLVASVVTIGDNSGPAPAAIAGLSVTKPEHTT